MSHKKEINERNKTMKETKITPKIVDTTIRCNGKGQRTHCTNQKKNKLLFNRIYFRFFKTYE
jgi:hypothetical protein